MLDYLFLRPSVRTHHSW